MRQTFTVAPPFWIFTVPPDDPYVTSGHLRIEPRLTHNGATYALSGLIYHGGFHFTARAFLGNGDSADTWYHDGMTMGRYVQYEGRAPLDTSSLLYAHTRRLHMAIYCRV